MRHIVREEPWATLDLDTATGNVLVRQDWQYTWQVDKSSAPWTHAEQLAYHAAVDRLIWRYWSFRARLPLIPTWAATAPTRELVQRFPRGLTLSFDVRRVRTPGHWRITVTKVDSNARPLPQAQVWFEQRLAYLYSTDVQPHRALRFHGDTASVDFFATPHEFGHAIGNRDDYRTNSPFFDDRRSIMNTGGHLRARHLRLVTAAVARMLPGCRVQAVVARK